MVSFDLLLVGATVVDPANDVFGKLDIGISEGKVEAVEEEISQLKAKKIIDLAGKVVIPGVVDSHVHVGGTGARDKSIGHQMMAKAGVTTAIDFGTTMGKLIDGMLRRGAGLNIGGLYPLLPYITISDRDPKHEEIVEKVDEALESGALGIKIMGGHSPLTPEATSRVIDICNEQEVYIALHAGTTKTGSHLGGMMEIPELIGDNRLHVAHINAYCRGLIKDPIEETKESLAILSSLKGKIVSESHLAIMNATSGSCEEGVPTDLVTQNCLQMKGYASTEQGLKQAFSDGYASAVVERGGEGVLVKDEEALKLWMDAGTNITVSFPVTPAISSFLCAVEKDKVGDFVVDAISTDGGVYPRNIAIERGLALVRFGALTLSELVKKLSSIPARMFGLMNKGHLGIGADADVTVIDLQRGLAVMSLVGGEPIMVDGVVLGREGTLLTTKEGVKGISAAGLKYEVVDIDKGLLYA
jgi:hypothetical protein